MVLFTLAGLAAAQLGGIEHGLAFGLLAGIVLANFVPLPRAKSESPPGV